MSFCDRRYLAAFTLLLAGGAACVDSSDSPPSEGLPDVGLPDAGQPETSIADASVPDTAVQDSAAPDVAPDVFVEDAGNDAMVDAGPVPDWFVDPVNGLDTNAGTSQATAFQTLCKAQSVATASQTIALLDGTYDSTNQRPANWSQSQGCGPTFADAVNIVSLHAGLAVVTVPVTMSAGGTVTGIKLARETGGALGSVSASSGTLLVSGVTYGNITSPGFAPAAPLVLSGTVDATVVPNGVTDYATVDLPVTSFNNTWAIVSGSAHLKIQGGTWEDFTTPTSDQYCNPLIVTSGAGSSVTLSGVTIRHKGTILSTSDGTVVIDQGSDLTNQVKTNGANCHATLEMAGPASVTVDGSTVRSGMQGVGNDVFGNGSGNLTLTNATLTDCSIGLELSGNSANPPAVTVTGSSITNTSVGISTTGKVLLTMRGTTVQGATGFGLLLGGDATSVYDFGTAASAGGNTFTGNAAGGVRVGVDLTVSAVGNTWIANQQGADGAGHYAAGLKTGPATGLNYELPAATNKLQL